MQIAVGDTCCWSSSPRWPGYAFAWLEFPGRDWLFIGVIGAAGGAAAGGADPDLHASTSDIGLFDTVLGLVLFHVAFGLPFAIFLLRNFFVGIPRDLLESARIDGASEWRIFLAADPAARACRRSRRWRSSSSCGRGTTCSWRSRSAATTQPITVAIFSQMRQFGSNIELIAPASFLSLAIPLLVFFAFQRYFVQGLLAGSVK